MLPVACNGIGISELIFQHTGIPYAVAVSAGILCRLGLDNVRNCDQSIFKVLSRFGTNPKVAKNMVMESGQLVGILSNVGIVV